MRLRAKQVSTRRMLAIKRGKSPGLANGFLGAELVFFGPGNDSELAIGDGDRRATVEKF